MSQNGSPAKLQGSTTRQKAPRMRPDGSLLRQKDSTVRLKDPRLASKGALNARTFAQRPDSLARLTRARGPLLCRPCAREEEALALLAADLQQAIALAVGFDAFG